MEVQANTNQEKANCNCVNIRKNNCKSKDCLRDRFNTLIRESIKKENINM